MIAELFVFTGLLLIGFIAGQVLEHRHLRSIRHREQRLGPILTFAKRFPANQQHQQAPHLVTGCVVISVDYFKRFVAMLYLLIGGRVKPYESLLERGRREALLRMKEQALALNANLIVNVKIETAAISKGATAQQIGCVEVLAYGTALRDPNLTS